MPDMAIGMYDWAVIVDHHRRRTWLIAADGAGPWRNRLERAAGACSAAAIYRETARLFGAIEALLNDTGKEQYRAAFDRIQHYIRDGDCYQVNLAQRFSVTVTQAIRGAFTGS